MRSRIWDMVLFSLLFMFVVSFPIELLGITDPIILRIISISLRAALIAFYVFMLYRARSNPFVRNKWNKVPYFIPFVIICFSNFIAVLMDPSAPFNWMMAFEGNIVIYFFLDVILTLETAFLEEIIFRYFIYNSIEYRHPLLRVVTSAGIFGLMHLLNMVQARTPTQFFMVIEQTVYAFGLGIFLGFIYEYSSSLISCMVLHFIFNFVNNDLFTYSGMNIFLNNTYYYAAAILTAAIALIYLFVIYFVKFKKERYY